VVTSPNLKELKLTTQRSTKKKKKKKKKSYDRDADMSDVETLDGVIPEDKDPSSSEDEDSEDEMTDMYQEPEHLLNDEHVISGSV
jgi:hypothetical protein